MNRNRHLSEETFGKRHIQPHMPKDLATKKKSAVRQSDMRKALTLETGEDRINKMKSKLLEQFKKMKFHKAQGVDA